MNNDAPEVVVETRDRVRILTFNRPHRANALTPTMMDLLVDLVTDAAVDPEVRVIILTGAGDRHFCAGGDLKAMADGSWSNRAPMQSTPFGPRRLRNPHEAVLETWKPTIAALNGAAVAGGFELALACDIRIAAENAVVGLAEAKRGLGAHFGSIMLPRIAPVGIALEMLYRGHYLSADVANRWGIVNHVVPQGEALSAALELAQEIARNAPLSLRRIKANVVKSSGLPLAAALLLDEGISPYTSEDAKEGASAFAENREPKWQGR